VNYTFRGFLHLPTLTQKSLTAPSDRARPATLPPLQPWLGAIVPAVAVLTIQSTSNSPTPRYMVQFWSRATHVSRGKCRDDRPVSIGLPPILESYWWKTLLTSADIKACLAFVADREKKLFVASL